MDLPGPDLLWSSDLAVWAPASQGDPRLSWGTASGKPRVTGVQVSVEGFVTVHPWFSPAPSGRI